MKPKLSRYLKWTVATVVLVGYGLLLWQGPWILDGSHIRSHSLQPADGVVITGVRTMLVAMGAAAIAGMGLIYTHRNHELAREQFLTTQKQFILAQKQFEHAQDQFAHTQQKDRDQANISREASAPPLAREVICASVGLPALQAPYSYAQDRPVWRYSSTGIGSTPGNMRAV
ncbi:hypothetical protein ABZS86_31365 [Streptomyces sp. NPDC005355]|uniref:hypothetical protein n=1 Tax=Streptomyces sp. NPDC005355 TaxID=3157038 RepID=UPI0033A84F3D